MKHLVFFIVGVLGAWLIMFAIAWLQQRGFYR